MVGDEVSSDGYIQRQSSSRHSGGAFSYRRSSLQRGVARWDGLTSNPKPLGFSTAIRCRPSQLTMALFPSGSHLVNGRVLWAWRRAEAGLTLSSHGRVSMRNGFGFP